VLTSRGEALQASTGGSPRPRRTCLGLPPASRAGSRPTPPDRSHPAGAPRPCSEVCPRRRSAVAHRLARTVDRRDRPTVSSCLQETPTGHAGPRSGRAALALHHRRQRPTVVALDRGQVQPDQATEQVATLAAAAPGAVARRRLARRRGLRGQKRVRVPDPGTATRLSQSVGPFADATLGVKDPITFDGTGPGQAGNRSP
jgi:hypothetical protein